MTPVEAGSRISDHVEAELVEMQPPLAMTPVPAPADVASPTQQTREATIEQTGADPPPKG